jgi:hypothetical protein
LVPLVSQIGNRAVKRIGGQIESAGQVGHQRQAHHGIDQRLQLLEFSCASAWDSPTTGIRPA